MITIGRIIMNNIRPLNCHSIDIACPLSVLKHIFIFVVHGIFDILNTNRA